MEENYNSTRSRVLECIGVYSMVLPVLACVAVYTGVAIGNNREMRAPQIRSNIPNSVVAEKNLTVENLAPRKVFRSISLDKVPEFH
jgi:hypothetical protein